MNAADLDFRNRSAIFDHLDGAEFDLVVIGAGITGAGIARDAAMRGLSVALVEARDIASGTSSRSSKMVHGGLRYLAQGDVGLVREAATERQTLRRIAPHLARPTTFVFPGSKGTLAKLRAGLWAFDKLGKVARSERHEVWSTAELAEAEPTLAADRFAGAVAYPECLTNDARLTLANVRSASEHGAEVLTYAPVNRIHTEGGRAVAVECRSWLQGEEHGAVIRGRVIVNAAGPWVDAVRTLEDPGAPTRVRLTKGIHVVVSHDRLPLRHAILMTAADKRPIFAVPAGPVTYIGTTDTFYSVDDYWPQIEISDVTYLLDAANRVFAGAAITSRDVESMWAGIRPLVAEDGKSPSEISRKDEVWEGPSGVLSVAGGKLTAYRTMARRVTDMVVDRLGRTFSECRTDTETLPGGESDLATLGRKLDGRLLAVDAERLVNLYGSEAIGIVDGGGDIAAEVAHAVACEGALTLEDYWVRRSARAWFGRDHDGADLAGAAEAMSRLLGWDADRTDAELAACRDHHRSSLACLD